MLGGQGGRGGGGLRRSLHPLQAKWPPLSQGRSSTPAHAHTHSVRLVLLLEEMVKRRDAAQPALSAVTVEDKSHLRDEKGRTQIPAKNNKKGGRVDRSESILDSSSRFRER